MVTEDPIPAPKEAPKPLKPEEKVRQAFIKRLINEAGWKENRLRWRPEWRVPKTPHDLTKRERGQRFDDQGTSDLVAFADDSGEPHALQVIFEFKEPTVDKGISQLEAYLTMEPIAKMGYWTNGTDSAAVYKRHSADWVVIRPAPIPRPFDDLTRPPDVPLTWDRMEDPSEAQLTAAFKRLLVTIVVNDARATRREDQLRELVHVLLVKLESDAKARRLPTQPVDFQIQGDDDTRILATAAFVRGKFAEYYARQRNRLFHQDDRSEILLTDESIYSIVAELYGIRILGDDIDLLAKAFQIFRSAALKSGEGQYLTPVRVVRPCVMAMEITAEDKVIDPACGTGSFIVEALRQVRDRDFPRESDSWDLVKWANDNLYGVDKDPLGVKLTRAVMISLRDGSTHALLGDSLRIQQWNEKYPRLADELGEPGHVDVARQFTVVITNPPFGEDLKISGADSKAAGFTIAKAAGTGRGSREYAALEIGLVFLELAHRLLQVGGRVGIILPETYFFSHKYRWLPEWLNDRLALRGMLNIPMEAFEEFCRAKTNFYIFEKVGEGPAIASDGTPEGAEPVTAATERTRGHEDAD